MKPLGTITNPFPFLGQEVTTVLKSLMESSRNYAQFLDRLLVYVLENDSPPLMVFYTVVQFIHAKGDYSVEPVLRKYQDLALIRPFMVRLRITSDEATSADVLNAADQIANNTTNPWVRFQMHRIRHLCATTHSVGSVIEEDALAQMEDLIDTHPKLKYFKPFILLNRSLQFYKEGRLTDALEGIEFVIKQAQLCNDINQVFNSYISKAYFLRNLDTKQSLEALDMAREISKELGLDIREYFNYNNIRGSVHNARGEYNLSLQFYNEACRILETQTSELRFVPTNLSWVYAEMEDGENALEWAKMALVRPLPISYESHGMSITLSRLARAFVLLGDLEKAEKYLEESETQALKIGYDGAIAENHIVAGHLEIARGNLDEAMFHFERGLEIAEQIHYQNRINSCLIGLARTEIAMLEADDTTSQRDTSGPWMKLLESEIERKELPGIRGQFLSLKAELRLKQGRYDEVRSLLRDIRTMAKEPGLDYLDWKANKLQLKMELESRR
ncbi:MAG: tetratricopeptide repeat protein [Candidatus Thorarchaeota archaeon]